MASHQSIVISGDLGSGKSTVSVELARRLGLRQVSVGDLYREMAKSLGMSALQLNLHAELDDAVDGYVDQLQSEIAKTDEQLVVDSRLAWFFFTDAFKVHLVIDQAIAAHRVMSRPADNVETYSSAAEAADRLASRSESERIRYLTRYGVDKDRLRNYDLICDTTRASAAEVVAKIIAAFEGSIGQENRPESPPLLLLDPHRIYPAGKARSGPALPEPEFRAGVGQAWREAPAPLSVGYARPSFYLIGGHDRLSAAIRNGSRLVTARLIAEGDEQVVDGLTSLQYFAAHVELAAR